MLRFSERCNFLFKEKESQNEERESVMLSENTVEEIFESELNEFSRPKIQMSSVKQVTSEVTSVQKKNVMEDLRDIQTRLEKSPEDINR